jgi:cytochrome c
MMKLNAVIAALLGIGLACAGGTARAIDADAAQALAKKSDCFKCHAVDKDKKGPSFAKTSAKYKGKPDGVDKVILNITTGPKVKMEDGTEEEHKIVKSTNKDDIKNLAEWILSH